MSVDAIRPVDVASLAAAAGAPPRPQREAPSFAATLARHLEGARAQVQGVRDHVASLRDGGAFRASTRREPPVTAAPLRATAGFDSMPAWLEAELARQATGDRADPYGWRAMAREAGDTVIGPGYGALFERQIQQESGFAPDVVYGLRVSSAGAEGIAQLMPQYYTHVDRTDPAAALVAGAKTMQHYLSVWDGDVRKALASYNAGLGRVRSLVDRHGDGWEAALPAETRHYLERIVGDAAPRFEALREADVAVFGGRGPGGVLTSPLAQVLGARPGLGWLSLEGAAGQAVRAPADGTVRAFEGQDTLVLDHGNGWLTALEGLASRLVGPGTLVQRGDAVGTLGADGLLRFGVSLDGRPLDPRRYLVGF